jgi:hypothetical protein
MNADTLIAIVGMLFMVSLGPGLLRREGSSLVNLLLVCHGIEFPTLLRKM